MQNRDVRAFPAGDSHRGTRRVSDGFLLGGWLPLLLACVTIFVASVVQTSSGMGFGMVAAPILILIDPVLVPGPVLLLSLLVSFLAAVREWQSIDFRGLWIALAGRIPGTIFAGLTIALVPVSGFTLIFGVLVLLAVLLSIAARPRDPTTGVLLTAGVVSGYMGTLTSIGAPPMILAYQHGLPATIRSTMSLFFVIGAGFSIITLAVFGRFGSSQIIVSAIFLPVSLAGFWLSNYLLTRLDRHRFRLIILGLSTTASLILIFKSLKTMF